MKVEVTAVVLMVLSFGALILVGRKLKSNFDIDQSTNVYTETEPSVNNESECLCAPCKTVEILYQNAQGKMTIRDIDILHVYQENKIWYVDAFCHLVAEQQKFNVDHIKCLKCPKHCSRLINPTEILEYLTQHI